MNVWQTVWQRPWPASRAGRRKSLPRKPQGGWRRGYAPELQICEDRFNSRVTRLHNFSSISEIRAPRMVAGLAGRFKNSRLR